MTREEHEYEQRLVRQLRKLAESCINVAEEIRRGGAPWAGSLVYDARRLLTAAEYYEQDRRRVAAEVARSSEPVRAALPSASEVTS